MQEMQVDAAKRSHVLRKGVEPALLRPPIECGAPIFDELLQIADIGAVSPWRARCLVGIPRACEPFAKIGNRLVGDFEGECLGLRGHVDLVFGAEPSSLSVTGGGVKTGWLR